MSYFRLHCDQLQLSGALRQESGPAIFRLARGEPYDAAADELPVRFSYASAGDKPLAAYYSGKCLLLRELVETLQGAGVDNLQIFPALLTEKATAAVREDYCVMNVIGKVAAADMKQSQAISLGEGHVFTRLTVDSGKARGLLMFRLAESLVDVIVHQRVAQAVAARQFRGVLLTPVTAP